MEQTIYKGFLTGIIPGLLSLDQPRNLGQSWVAHDVTLTFAEEKLTVITLSWNGYKYTSTKCTLVRPDYYQLSLQSSGNWEDKAYLTIYRNERGLVITGDWISTTESEVWGRFQKA